MENGGQSRHSSGAVARRHRRPGRRGDLAEDSIRTYPEAHRQARGLAGVVTISARQDAWCGSHQMRFSAWFTTADALLGQRQVMVPSAAVLHAAAKASPGRPAGTSLIQAPPAAARTMEAVRPTLRSMALLTPG